MLERFPATEAAFIREVRRGTFELVTPTNVDLGRIEELVLKYADLPLGTTDASVIATAERFGVSDVATIDRRHFRIVRPAHVPTLTLLP